MFRSPYTRSIKLGLHRISDESLAMGLVTPMTIKRHSGIAPLPLAASQDMSSLRDEHLDAAFNFWFIIFVSFRS